MPRLHDMYQNPNGTMTVKVMMDDGEIVTYPDCELDIGRMTNPQPGDTDVLQIEPVRIVNLPHPTARALGWSQPCEPS
jgi:hypothetical protein